jgi:hypothetical protein
VNRNPNANSIGVGSRIWPPHRVPIQLKNFTPVGTAISMENALKNGSSTAPVANMWWAHTPRDSTAMAMVAKTSPA